MKAMHILPSLDAERRISVTWGGSTFGLWRANSVRVAESSSQADEGGRRPAFLDPKDPASTASLTDLAVLSEEDEEEEDEREEEEEEEEEENEENEEGTTVLHREKGELWSTLKKGVDDIGGGGSRQERDL